MMTKGRFRIGKSNVKFQESVHKWFMYLYMVMEKDGDMKDDRVNRLELMVALILNVVILFMKKYMYDTRQNCYFSNDRKEMETLAAELQGMMEANIKSLEEEEEEEERSKISIVN